MAAESLLDQPVLVYDPEGRLDPSETLVPFGGRLIGPEHDLRAAKNIRHGQWRRGGGTMDSGKQETVMISEREGGAFECA